MKVLTYATDRKGFFPCLEESCKKFGYDLRTVGMGEKWKGFLQSQVGLLEAVMEFDPREMVLVVDGFDVVITSEPGEVLSHFERKRRELGREGDWIMIGKEHPKEECSTLYRKTVRKLAVSYMGSEDILNTGALLGTAAGMRRYFSSLIDLSSQTREKDDQKLANLFWKWWSNKDKNATEEGSPFDMFVDDDGIFFCFCERRLPFVLLKFVMNPMLVSVPCDDFSFFPKTERNGKRKDAAFEKQGLYWKGRKRVAVLHGIWNTDLSPVCSLLGLEASLSSKKSISQPDLYLLANGVRMSVYLVLLFLFSALFWEGDTLK